MEEQAHILVVEDDAAGEGDVAIGSTQWNQGIAPWEFGIQSRFYNDPYEALFYTDRPLYRPGQPVYFI